MNFSAFFNPIAAAFRAAALALSMVDGKPGLTSADFAIVLEKVAQLSGRRLPNSVKAEEVAQTIRIKFGAKLPTWPWISQAIGWVAYVVAKRLNLLLKPE